MTPPEKDLIYSKSAKRFMARYASIPENSRGKLFKEDLDINRSIHQRDRDRIIISSAFRRLKYKMQVFVNHAGDHFRTRLTHSLEVSQIARSVARELFLDEDLTEAISLAHDLGHAPFGHLGEDVLKERMQDYDGFDHNAQTIAILTKLERKYGNFTGLNLSWECLEGIAKHNGPIKNPPRALAEYNEKNDLELNTHASLEAQIAAISDDIAYIAHDIKDGIRASLFRLEDLSHLPIIGDIIKEVIKKFNQQRNYEVKRTFISKMITDLNREIKINLKKEKIETVEDVRKSNKNIAHLSSEYEESRIRIKSFLYENMYLHYKVKRMCNKLKNVINDLFDYYLESPDCLPDDWRIKEYRKSSKKDIAIIVCNYIAGMTDRYALIEHKKLFDHYHSAL